MNPLAIDLDETVRSYWQKRLWAHHGDTYRGRQLVKMPEDLRVYQHVIERTKPDVIIELGTYDGGSALWFADQLTALCGGGSVITIDVDGVDPHDERVTYLQGDLRNVRLPSIKGSVMVVDDSAHTYDVTLASLRRFGSLVTKGCFFVVEDTIVDTELSIWPGVQGAGKAVEDYLCEDARFISRELSYYGLTMHMGGWLEAVA